MSASQSPEERHATFLRKMAHEMRTPLGSMLMLAELLADNAAGRLGEREIGYARKLQQAGSEVSNLLTAVLDLSRIETGAITAEPRQVQVSDLAAEIRQLAVDKELAIDVEIESGSPVAVSTDRAQLKRLIGALLDHCSRHARDVEIGLRITPAEEGGVALELRHGGAPILDDAQASVFEPFQPGQRGAAALTLPIARALAELLGGRLELAHDGNAFHLTLPG